VPVNLSAHVVALQAANTAGKRVNKAATIGGKRQLLTLCRMIFKLAPDAAWPVPADQLLADVPRDASTSGSAAAPKGKGTGKKGKKGKAGAAAAAAAATASALAEPGAEAETAGGEVGVAGAAKVFSEEVAAVKGSTFEMEAVREPLAQSGRYGALACTR
jgi:hypothetical protein